MGMRCVCCLLCTAAPDDPRHDTNSVRVITMLQATTQEVVFVKEDELSSWLRHRLAMRAGCHPCWRFCHSGTRCCCLGPSFRFVSTRLPGFFSIFFCNFWFFGEFWVGFGRSVVLVGIGTYVGRFRVGWMTATGNVFFDRCSSSPS